MQKDLSIAVLPFKNMSSDEENEYFCDGITEEIINALAKIDQLKVTSRTSSFHFKNKEIPISEIAQTLEVTTILEGSVRLSGNVLRITGQLIEAKKDFHFWSETWDRKLENIFEIQDEISLLIADKIRENFGHFEIQDHLVKKQTEDINVYENSLMARFHKNKWNTEDIKIAEKLYLKAIEQDPNHVESIVGLSDVYSFMAMTGIMSFMEAWSKSNKLVNRAFALDPKNPEIFYQKANAAFFTDCNYSESLVLATKAIQLKPNYVEAQQFMSFLHVLSGNKQKAKEHLDIALGIDPLSQETLFFSAYFDYMSEDFTSSLSKLNECIEANPRNLPAHSVKCLCLIMLGRLNDVLHYFDKDDFTFVEGERLGAIALANAMKGNKTETEKNIEFFKDQAKSPDGFTLDSFLFMLYASIGDLEKAFEWVSTAIENKSTLLLLRYADPIINPLKSDSRYEEYHRILFSSTENSVKKKKKALLDEATAATYKSRLLEHLKESEPFLDTDLSLRTLAEQIKIHPNQLSWLLNKNIGKSFNEFINAYRIEAFKKLVKDPKSVNFTLIGMAYDSGFNSKTVFNTYFKKETGLTPKQYVSIL